MQNFTKYLSDTAAELRQVSWPTQRQALLYTALVVGITTVVSILVGSFDFLFGEAINLIINRI
jgi:preprotein translocase SecE subunit